MKKPSFNTTWAELGETCNKHPNSHLVKLPNGSIYCPICKQEELDNKKLAYDKEQTNIIYRSFLSDYSILDDRNNLNKTFDNFKAQSGTKEETLKNIAHSIAGRYFKNPNKGFNTIFFGNAGAGKTHLASAIVNANNENADPARKCLILNINAMYSMVKASYSGQRKSITKEQVLDLVKQSNLVLLDDLGKESTMTKRLTEANRDFQDLLYNIVGKSKRLIITTNLTPEELEQVYDQSLTSRLRENSIGSILDFNGVEDKRPNLDYYK